VPEWLTPLAVLFIGGGIASALAYGGQAVLTRSAASGRNETVGIYLALAAAILGTYLAFITVAVWERRSDAELSARLEAADLWVLMQLTHAQPEPQRRALQELVLDYTQSIVAKDWPALATAGAQRSFRRSPELDRIWSALLAPQAGGSAMASAAVDRLGSLAAARERRLLASSTSLSPYIWFTLTVGTIVNLALLMLVRVEEKGLHALLVGSCAGLTLMVLWGIYDMQTPYVGAWSVTAEPFTQVASQMKDFVSR